MAPATPISNSLAAGLVPRSASPDTAPTKTLLRRQIVTESAPDDGLSGGAIAGIVIGSIVGLLLLLWIIKSCGVWGRPEEWAEKDSYHDRRYRGRSPGSRHRRRHHHHYHHETSRSRRPSTIEVNEVRYSQPVVYEKRRASASPRPPAAVYRSSRSRTRY